MKRILIFILITIISFSCKKADKDFLSLNEQAFSTAIAGLYVRENPSMAATTIGLLKYNTQLIIIGYSKNEDTINGIKAPWAKIKVKNDSYDQTIEGWVFSGLISKNKPLDNKELINNDKKDISSIIKLLDKTIRINLRPGALGSLFFSGKNIIRNNSFIQIDVSIGGKESYIENISYSNDIATLKIKHKIFDSNEDKVIKTEFYKCDISKKMILNAYNDNIEKSEFECTLEK